MHINSSREKIEREHHSVSFGPNRDNLFIHYGSKFSGYDREDNQIDNEEMEIEIGFDPATTSITRHFGQVSQFQNSYVTEVVREMEYDEKRELFARLSPNAGALLRKALQLSLKERLQTKFGKTERAILEDNTRVLLRTTAGVIYPIRIRGD